MDKPRTIKVDDVELDAKNIEDLRKNLVTIRSQALDQGAMDWAVLLSYCIAVMGWAKDQLEPAEQGEVT